MNRMLLSCLALGAMTSVATAGPIPMTAQQMDAVTAGDAFATAFGGAIAFGKLTRTYTDTRSTAVQNGPVGVGVAVGFGSAIGGGGPLSGAAAGTGAAADGDLGIAQTLGVGIDLPGFDSAQSLSVAVGVGLGGLLP